MKELIQNVLVTILVDGSLLIATVGFWDMGKHGWARFHRRNNEPHEGCLDLDDFNSFFAAVQIGKDGLFKLTICEFRYIYSKFCQLDFEVPTRILSL
jgi:hypothetical protein